MSKAEIEVFAFAGALAVAAVVVGASTGNAAVAGALAVLSPVAVIVYQSFWTRRAAEASLAIVRETQRDRELAVQPVLIASTAVLAGNGSPVVQLQNIGRGPAIRVRIFWRVNTVPRYTSQVELHLGAGATLPAAYHPAPGIANTQEGPGLQLTGQRLANEVPAEVVGFHQPENFIAYCLDQLGNRLRFNLRTGEPPKVWPSNDEAPPPDWAGFLELQ